ncbi:MAG: response regulator transcription factor [Gammaproteobacteria bacterium]|nr:response regulator transcription factor [Gammaproteobacteria bacterium]
MTRRQTMTVLLVDDHAVVRAGIRCLLEHEGYARVVGEAARGEEACRLYPTLEPDVVVMDISLPGMSGIDATRRICARDERARVLMLSVHDNALFAQRAFEAGALGYLTKSSDGTLLGQALEEVCEGRRYLGPDIAQAFFAHTAAGAGNPLCTLGEREFAVFQLLVAGHSTQGIAERLHVSSKTVSNNVSGIKHKLGVQTTVELVHLALRHGMME